MDIIEELVKKYHGEYSKSHETASNMAGGRYTFQPERGIVKIEGTKISININAVGGAAETAEPYRIVLHLNKAYNSTLEIYPKSTIRRLFDFFISSNQPTNSNLINKRFTFKGNKQIIEKLGIDNVFCKKIKDEVIYIVINKKYPKRIMLTPAYGIDNVEHLEKLLSILKIIEGKIIMK